MTTSSTAEQNRCKVLLVDDDAVSLELAALLIAHEGHEVLRAPDAGTALELLAAEKAARPNVMLVDLQMPGVSGGQLAQRVRALGSPEPLLLAMSATEAQRQQLLAFDGFLLKPLAIEELRKALDPGKKGQPGTRAKRKIPTSAAEVLDMSVVGKLLTMMPPAALQDVIYACIADTRTCVETLRKQRNDHDGTRQTAHRIKGAASMIGATRLAGIAASLESGSGKVAATSRVFDDLLSACSELEDMLLAGKFKTT